MTLRPLSPLEPADGDRPTPTWCHGEVLLNRRLTDRYRHLRLAAPAIAASARAGQFVMLTAAKDESAGPVLPRPMAIYTRD